MKPIRGEKKKILLAGEKFSQKLQHSSPRRFVISLHYQNQFVSDTNHHNNVGFNIVFSLSSFVTELFGGCKCAPEGKRRP